jgi:hypothetical protein
MKEKGKVTWFSHVSDEKFVNRNLRLQDIPMSSRKIYSRHMKENWERLKI